MDLCELIKLLPPPAKPVDAPTHAIWHSVERKLRLVMPGDYKQFISTYGVGCIDGFLWVFSPASENVYLNLSSQILDGAETLRQLRDDWREDISYPIYPDPGGVVPWGGTDNGHTLYWMGGTHESSIVVQDARTPEWCSFRMSITGFLIALLSRRISVDIFPEGFPAAQHTYTPPGDWHVDNPRMKKPCQ